MSGATGENKTKKPGKYDSRYSMSYYGLLSGSLLMVGGITGSRFFRMSRFPGWSFLCFTTSITGMYLTLSSIQRLYENSRESITDEAENSEISFEHSKLPEILEDKNTEINPLHVIEFTDDKISEDVIVENAVDDSADEKNEVLINVVTNIDANSEETNIFEDSADQSGCNEVIVLMCESAKIILPEEVDDECSITQDFVAEDFKDAEVTLEKKAFDENNKEAKFEEATVKLINNDLVSESDIKGYDIKVTTANSFILTDINASSEIKNVVTNESFKKQGKVDENEDKSKENIINSPVYVDCLTKRVYNEAVAFLKDYKTKEPNIEKEIATNINNIPELIVVDDLTTGKLDMGIGTNEIIEEDSFTQESDLLKFIEKDTSVKNIVVEDDLTESILAEDAKTILDDVVKKAKLVETYGIIDGPLIDDVGKSKLSEEIKINESNEYGSSIEGVRKEMTAMDTTFQDEIITMEEGIKKAKFKETITKDFNIEFPEEKDCITENTSGVMVNENITEIDIEKVVSKDMCIEHGVDVVEYKLYKDITINETMEENILTQESKGRKALKRDETIKNTVAEDEVTESKLDKDVNDMVKKDRIEEIAAKHENTEDALIKSDENMHTLNKEGNVFNNENIIEEKIENMTAKDIFEASVADDVDNRNSIKKMFENESREKVFKKTKNEETAPMHLRIENILSENNGNQRNFDMEIRKIDIEKCNIQESEIDISKDINVEDNAFRDVIVDTLNIDDLEEGILKEAIMKFRIKEVVAKNATIDVFENEVCETDLSGKIVVNAPLEDSNIIQSDVVGNIETECSIDENVVKHIVEETFSEGFSEEIFEKKIIKNIIAEDDSRNTIEYLSSECGIGSPCIPVKETTLTKDTESRNDRYAKATTEEQNVNESLLQDFDIAMSQTEQSPKLVDNPTTQHINQFLSNSTDELRFLSPNTDSGIGVLFRKSNKNRLAAHFPNTFTEPSNESKESKSPLSKHITKTPIRTVLTNPSLNTSSSAVITTPVETFLKSTHSPIESDSEHFSRLTNDKVYSAKYFPTASDTVIANTNIQSSEILTNFKDTIASQPTNVYSNILDTPTKKASTSTDCRTISSTSKPLKYSERNVKSATSRYSTGLAAYRTVTLDPKHRQSAGTSRSSVLLNNQTCNADLSTEEISSDSDGVVASLAQLPKTNKGILVLSSLPDDVKQDILHSIQQPTFLDIAGISATDRHLRLPETTTISAKYSLPVISDRDASITIQFQKSSDNMSGTSVGHLPKSFGSPSDNPRRQSPKTYNTKVTSFDGRSPRSQTHTALSHVRHSSNSPDIHNHLGHTFKPSVRSYGHLRRSSWNGASPQSRHSFRHSSNSPDIENHLIHTFSPSVRAHGHLRRSFWYGGASPQSRHSFGRGISLRPEPPTSKENGHPWSSCDDISGAGHPTKPFKRDIFPLVRKSPWSSCGDVSSHANHFRNTNDEDIFFYAPHFPGVSGSGTIFHDGNSPRNISRGRSFSHPRYSRRTYYSSGVSHVRHSLSPTGYVALSSENSPTFSRNVQSPRVQSSSASLYATSTVCIFTQSVYSASATTLNVQSVGESVDSESSVRQSPNAPVDTVSSDRQSSNAPVDTVSSDNQSPNAPVDTDSSGRLSPNVPVNTVSFDRQIPNASIDTVSSDRQPPNASVDIVSSGRQSPNAPECTSLPLSEKSFSL